MRTPVVEVPAERAPSTALAALALVLATGLGLASCADSPSPDPRPAGSAAPPGDATTTTTTGQRLVAPALAEHPADLADRLVAAEDAVRDLSSTPLQVTQAAFEAQVLYRQLARTPQWRDRVLHDVGGYRDAVVDHLTARDSLRSVLTTLSAELPAWRIVRPAPLEDLLGFYREGERTHGVPWEVLAAVNLVETGFGKIRGYSSAGARGPMQFIPATWEAYGEGDIDDPHDSILAAANYLAASGGASPTGLDGALHAYNHHAGYVRGVRAYARILERDPDALNGLYRWQIIYLSTRGDVWLPIGYREREQVAVGSYLRQHPERLLSRDTR